MPSSLPSLLSTVFRLFGRQNRQQNGQHGLGENVAAGRTVRLLHRRHELHSIANSPARIEGTFLVRIEPGRAAAARDGVFAECSSRVIVK